MMLNRNSSNRTYTTGERKPSIGGSAKRALPKIDHSKQMDKLRSITGKSEDFSLGAHSNSNVQFSKPKIGVGKRESSASHGAGGLKNSRVGSKQDLRQSSQDGSRSELQKRESLIKQRKRVASQGMRTDQKIAPASDSEGNQPSFRIRSNNRLAPNLQGSAKSRKQLPP